MEIPVVVVPRLTYPLQTHFALLRVGLVVLPVVAVTATPALLVPYAQAGRVETVAVPVETVELERQAARRNVEVRVILVLPVVMVAVAVAVAVYLITVMLPPVAVVAVALPVMLRVIPAMLGMLAVLEPLQPIIVKRLLPAVHIPWQ
jgi:hypothetical protein